MRVACVGDSITHGVGLQANETYPAQLQRRLRADGRADAEVLNFGLNGASRAVGDHLGAPPRRRLHHRRRTLALAADEAKARLAGGDDGGDDADVGGGVELGAKGGEVELGRW